MRQKGIAHVLLLVILLIGIVAGVYLVQQRQIFKPKAAESQIKITNLQFRTPLGGEAVTEFYDDSDIVITFNKHEGANYYNLWVDYCERWKLDGTCDFTGGEILVQKGSPANQMEVFTSITFNKDHPKHTPGVHKVGVHAYSCNPRNTNECTGFPAVYMDLSIGRELSPTCTVTGASTRGICGRKGLGENLGGWNCLNSTDYGLGYAGCTPEFPNCFVGCVKN